MLYIDNQDGISFKVLNSNIAIEEYRFADDYDESEELQFNACKSVHNSHTNELMVFQEEAESALICEIKSPDQSQYLWKQSAFRIRRSAFKIRHTLAFGSILTFWFNFYILVQMLKGRVQFFEDG